MNGRPYYIYVPTLKGRSAGIRVLLKLGRLLKELGHAVFIAVPSSRTRSVTVEGVELPVLDAALLLESVFHYVHSGVGRLLADESAEELRVLIETDQA